MSSPTKKMENSVCDECKANPWKYKCPGCSIRSCSLPCVKSHKQRTGCSGKRNVTQFVPLSQFDDNLLLSDYNMLEDVKRVAESAQRVRTKLCRYPYFRLPFFLQSLRSAAASRRTKILFLPNGMMKREKNQTRYDNRKKTISWTIEWRFHSTDVVLTDHGVSEDTSLNTLLRNHLKPGPWIHKLKPFCDVELDSLKCFIRKYPKGAKSPFKELNMKAPLRQQLGQTVILEYPVIHVFLPSQSYDFEIIKDTVHVNSRPAPKDSVNKAEEGPHGITFKEEEIEGDDLSSFEPKVLDLIKQVNCSPCQPAPEESRVENGVPRDSNPRVERGEEGGNCGEMELELDQGLLDTYSEIFAEMNPDDFFDFEGDLEIDDDGNLENLGIGFAEDGPEEGEIVE
ncbi:PREDICTED: box C/D snoRNA protein 1 [Tarenaya hassleriana]|uniref:box C/D snoRNA protein 1 n=1 Tax=Tarenaya hassleriana TaxID=28532 RepID=UPI00053C8D60|nr:PREDICTED: box C/D snoRNA protein 1 [Tarenaya hassleriana]